MKNAIILVAFVVFAGCSTSRSLYDQTFDKALIGQNEMIIYSRMGQPTRIENAPRGGKVLVYEFDTKGMFLTPYKSALKYSAKPTPTGERQGWSYTFGENTAANDPKYTIYQTNVSYFKVYLDKEGKCTHYEQNMPGEQLDIYHERFKHLEPQKR